MIHSSCLRRSIKGSQTTSLRWRGGQWRCHGDSAETVPLFRIRMWITREVTFFFFCLFLCHTCWSSPGRCRSNDLRWFAGRSPWSLALQFAHTYILALFSLSFETARLLCRGFFAYSNDLLMPAIVATRRCDCARSKVARSAAGTTRSASFRGNRENRVSDDALGVFSLSFFFFSPPKRARRCQGLIYANEKKK